jgi:TetR/AcrR family transcriptional regulator
MGLIIHYFKSKEGLYEAVLVQAYQPLREALNQSSSDQTSAPRTLC